MDIKEVANSMQDIEFILFSLVSQDNLKKEEVVDAHKKAKQIMEQYLLPLGAFKD